MSRKLRTGNCRACRGVIMAGETECYRCGTAADEEPDWEICPHCYQRFVTSIEGDKYWLEARDLVVPGEDLYEVGLTLLERVCSAHGTARNLVQVWTALVEARVSLKALNKLPRLRRLISAVGHSLKRRTQYRVELRRGLLVDEARAWALTIGQALVEEDEYAGTEAGLLEGESEDALPLQEGDKGRSGCQGAKAQLLLPTGESQSEGEEAHGAGAGS
jgi:hypothetical protein